jgi:hypothetical protein
MTTRIPAALLFAAGLGVFLTPAAAQLPAVPVKAAVGPVNQQDPKQIQTIALTVSATPAPVPTLKFELLPRLRDRVAGNAATDYRRAALLRPSWPRDPKESRAQDEMIQKWEDGPVDKLPVADVRKFLSGYSASFRALDFAAKCDRCDWELTQHLSPNNFDMFLPEVQQYRELTRMNRLRVREALAANDFPAAAEYLRAGFRMGKDVGEGPILINMLVGIALTAIYQGEIDRWLERPDAPNLYWALATLPHPFVDPKPALEGEARLVAGLFPTVKDLEKGPVTPERANRVVEDMLSALHRTTDRDQRGGLDALLGKFGAAAYVTANYPDAKKELVELGFPAADVDRMPPAQVVALRAITVYRTITDDQTKSFSLPYPRAVAELARVKERAAKLKKTTDPLLAVFALTIPATEKVHNAFSRTDRRFAAQRAVEAVRLHAAANNGQPPKALSDVTAVIVPDDPFTGKPFEYTATGNRFTLTAGPPPGEQPHAGNSFRYEVTVRGK